MGWTPVRLGRPVRPPLSVLPSEVVVAVALAEVGDDDEDVVEESVALVLESVVDEEAELELSESAARTGTTMALSRANVVSSVALPGMWLAGRIVGGCGEQEKMATRKSNASRGIRERENVRIVRKGR